MPEPTILINPGELESFGKLTKRVEATATTAREPATIEDEEDASRIADLLANCKYIRQDVGKAKKEEAKPYADTKRAIDGRFDEIAGKLNGVEASLKDRLRVWNAEKQRRADEERKREERNARRRQEREDEKAAKEGRASHDKMGAPPPPPPPQGARGSSGVKASVRKIRKYEIVSEAELPDRFVRRVPNREAIKAAVAQGEVVPGVRQWTEDEVVTR